MESIFDDEHERFAGRFAEPGGSGFIDTGSDPVRTGPTITADVGQAYADRRPPPLPRIPPPGEQLLTPRVGPLPAEPPPAEPPPAEPLLSPSPSSPLPSSPLPTTTLPTTPLPSTPPLPVAAFPVAAGPVIVGRGSDPEGPAFGPGAVAPAPVFRPNRGRRSGSLPRPRPALVSVDNNRCHLYAICQMEAPRSFLVGRDGRLHYDAAPSPEAMPKVRQAARLCPMQAIAVRDN